MKTTIKQAKQYINQEVTIGAWLTNKRSSGKIAFYNYVMVVDLCKVLSLNQKLTKKHLNLLKTLHKNHHYMSQVQLQKIIDRFRL